MVLSDLSNDVQNGGKPFRNKDKAADEQGKARCQQDSARCKILGISNARMWFNGDGVAGFFESGV